MPCIVINVHTATRWVILLDPHSNPSSVITGSGQPGHVLSGSSGSDPL